MQIFCEFDHKFPPSKVYTEQVYINATSALTFAIC